MSKAAKTFIIIAIVLIVTGITVGGIGFAFGGMSPVLIGSNGLRVVNAKELSNADVVNSVYTDVRNITIDADMVPVVRVIRGGELAVRAQNPKLFGGVSARTEGDTLVITSKQRGLNVFNVGNMFQNKGYIEITVPEGVELNKVKITSNFPNVTISDLSAADLRVDCDMGAVNIEDSTVGRLSANADMGAVKVVRTRADTMTATADMGALRMKDVNVGAAEVRLNAGGADLVNFESGGLDLSCDMGGVKITGVLKGNSEISCDMGGIDLNLRQPTDSLSWDIETDLGAAYVNGAKARGAYAAPNPQGTLKATANMGSVHIDFMD